MSSLSENQKEIFGLLSGKTIAYNPELAIVLGSVEASILIGQLLFWRGKGKWGNWVYKTVAEMKEETGLTRSNQDTAIKRCESLGVLEKKRRGFKGKRQFYVHKDKLKLLIVSMRQAGKLIPRKPAFRYAETQPSITENTTKITTNNSFKETEIIKKKTTEGFTPIGSSIATKQAELVGRK